MIERNYTYAENNNSSYNVFNVDGMFSWQFAPGSLLSVVYKNAIEKEDKMLLPDFTANFSKIIQSPQTNSISLKVVCYLDYEYLNKKMK